MYIVRKIRVLLYTQRSYNHVMERLGIHLEVLIKIIHNNILCSLMFTLDKIWFVYLDFKVQMNKLTKSYIYVRNIFCWRILPFRSMNQDSNSKDLDLLNSIFLYTNRHIHLWNIVNYYNIIASYARALCIAENVTIIYLFNISLRYFLYLLFSWLAKKYLRQCWILCMLVKLIRW